MKTLKLLTPLFLIIFVSFAILSGCGKSDKEEKVTSKENASGNKGDKTVKIDINESTVNWLGKKVTGQHHGTIKILNGEINLDKDKVVGGSFEIDMKTITDLDLQDENNVKLTNHLKSADFFDADKFPTSKFEITNVTPLNDPVKPNYNFSVKGNLTMKGKTNGITYPASIKVENGVVTASADFDIDRTQWEIKYGSGKFFDNLGDKMINDNFNIQFNITAK
jgi:polyisoprenoid-binding protein YceI